MPHYLVGLMPADKQPSIVSTRQFQEGWSGPAITSVQEAVDAERACEQAAAENGRPGNYFAVEITPVEVGLKAT